MKLIAGWAVSATLLLAAATAQAQSAPPPYRAGVSPYARASDFDNPYAEPPPGYGYGDASFLPPHEVYEVLRETGFSPIGVPRLRGFVYVITAVDRRGDDGRLVIDARTGQVLNFTPMDRMGGNDEADTRYGNAGPYGPRGAPPPPPAAMAAMPAGPRPPAAIPHVASRATPQTQPAPKVVAARPEPAPQPQPAAAAPPKPTAAVAAAAPSPAATATVGQAKPAAPAASQILPTQPMPQAQDLEY